MNQEEILKERMDKRRRERIIEYTELFGKPKGNLRICPACNKVFTQEGTLPNLKGFCSKKCYEAARKLYIYEEKRKLGKAV